MRYIWKTPLSVSTIYIYIFFYREGHKSDTLDFYVPPQEGEDLVVLEAQEDEFFMKKINWEQMLPTQILLRDWWELSHQRYFHWIHEY